MKRLMIGLGLLAFFAGCDDRDLAAMRRVGDKALEKAGALAAQAKTKVPLPMPETPPTAAIAGAGPTVADKVKKRLQWDKELAGAAVVVRDEQESLVLTGTVPSEHARRRAVGLAETTQGASRVVDQLEVKAVPQ